MLIHLVISADCVPRPNTHASRNHVIFTWSFEPSVHLLSLSTGQSHILKAHELTLHMLEQSVLIWIMHHASKPISSCVPGTSCMVSDFTSLIQDCFWSPLTFSCLRRSLLVYDGWDNSHPPFCDKGHVLWYSIFFAICGVFGLR